MPYADGKLSATGEVRAFRRPESVRGPRALQLSKGHPLAPPFFARFEACEVTAQPSESMETRRVLRAVLAAALCAGGAQAQTKLSATARLPAPLCTRTHTDLVCTGADKRAH